MERVAIICPHESSLPLANSARDRIGRWSHAICLLTADPGGNFVVFYLFRKGEGTVAYHYQQVQAVDGGRRGWKLGLIKNNELHGLISHWYLECSSLFIIMQCQISDIFSSPLTSICLWTKTTNTSEVQSEQKPWVQHHPKDKERVTLKWTFWVFCLI